MLQRHESKDAIINDDMLIEKAKMYGIQLGVQDLGLTVHVYMF